MKIDRMIGILSILLQKDLVTTGELAKKFEVSQRTILRDIEAIAKAGIPIASRQGQGGGFYIMEGYRIDRTVLSSDKLSASESRSLNADSHIIIDLSSWDKAAVSDKIGLIKSVMESEETLEFTYFSPSGESERVIEPYHLVYQWASWYVWGYCTKRRDWRMFKLTRMTQVRRTGKKRAQRQVPAYSCDKLRHTKGGTKVLVRFDKSLKWRLIDEYGTQIPQFDGQGNILIEFEWDDTASFYQYILTFSDKAEILSPESYRREFARLVKKISGRYKI